MENMVNAVQKHYVLAAVDIGSHSIRMKICEVDCDAKIAVLETVKKSINLGKDTFISGRIKHDHVEDICAILKSCKKLISEFETDKYVIVATSALREANNCEYILDYIYQKTGLKIEVISESEEIFYTYGSISDTVNSFPRLKEEGILIIDIGSGGAEITLFNNGDLVFTQYIKMGALRLKEVLSNLERKTLNFPNLISEFIESEIDTLKILLLQNKVKNFMVIGTEIQVLHSVLGNRKKNYDKSVISREAFYKIYQQMIGKSRQQIMEKFGLSPESVETLVPALLLYEKFLSFTSSERIYTPGVSLCDGLLRYMTDKKFGLKNNAFSEADIIVSIKKLGERYSYDAMHAAQVEKTALTLFDNTRRLHGYSDKERLKLQIAAIAHDFGKYINIKEHNIISKNIILNSDILGLSKKDINIIANIIRYHANNTPESHDINYNSMDFESRIMVSKLAAYLKLADALDRSHKQKLVNINAIQNEGSLVIKAETNCDSLLEEWEFERKSGFFRDVYGINPTLIIKLPK